MFKNMVLREISGQKKDVIIRTWGRIYNEELHKLHPSRNIIRMIKSRRIR
jgi:hypothetical protein